MIPMYLKEDHTGPYSKIEYGKKGDIVFITKREHNMVLVTSESGYTFHINESKLSQSKIEKDAIIPTKQGLKRKV